MAIEANALIRTPKGNVKVCDLSVGDNVYTYRNGRVVWDTGGRNYDRYGVKQTITSITQSPQTKGFLIETESGKGVAITQSQKLWASHLLIDDNEYVIYLMYRSDLGYRVGKTNKTMQDDTPYGNRAQQENAEKLWIIRTADGNEEAILHEEMYSLEYGIPTSVFKGAGRGLNQKRIDTIFANFGNNGERLLIEKGYDFDNPHWRKCSIKGHALIHVNAHSTKHSTVGIEWYSPTITAKVMADDELRSRVRLGKQTVTCPDTRYCIRSYEASMTKCLAIADKMQAITGAPINHQLYNASSARYPLHLTNGAQLFTRQQIVIWQDDAVANEKIVGISPVYGESFFDIKVSDACNLFANDCLLAAY